MKRVRDYLVFFGGLIVYSTGISVNAFWLVQPGNDIWWLCLAAIIVIGSLLVASVAEHLIEGAKP